MSRTFLSRRLLPALLAFGWVSGGWMKAGDVASAINAPPARAMWVYETEKMQESAEAREELFQFCAARKVTDLFWQMHFRREPKTGTFEIGNASALSAFLSEAHKHRLRIHALAGDPAHTLTKNHDRVLARVDALIAFNQGPAKDAPFAGLHLDIEPHALPEWKTATDAEKCALLTQLVELNAKVVEKIRAESPALLYGTDITFWLDKTNADGAAAYPVTFRGVTKDATRHLLDMGIDVALMSYRGTADGENGIIAIVERAVTYADTAKGRVFVGVKMADIGPKMESFFGRSESEMNAELKKIDATYATHRGYAGIAFFMYSAFKAMPR